jgi:hypothetical protein
MLLSWFRRHGFGRLVFPDPALWQMSRPAISPGEQSVRIMAGPDCSKKDTNTNKCCFFEKTCYIFGMECANLALSND